MNTWRTKRKPGLTAGDRLAVARANFENATAAHLAGVPGAAAKLTRADAELRAAEAARMRCDSEE